MDYSVPENGEFLSISSYVQCEKVILPRHPKAQTLETPFICGCHADLATLHLIKGRMRVFFLFFFLGFSIFTVSVTPSRVYEVIV